MQLEDLFKLFDKTYLLDDITVDEVIINKRKIFFREFFTRYSDYTIKRIEFNDENSCSVYIYKKGVKNMTDLEKTKTVLEALGFTYGVDINTEGIELEVYDKWGFLNVLYFNHDESLKERGE